MIRAQGAGLRREIDQLRDELRADVAELRADVADVRRDVAEARRDLRDLGERVARIEGALTGPWRAPTNGGSPPVSTSEADA